MKYFSFFESTWDITDSAGNTGIFKIAKGVSGQCHVLTYSAGDNKFDEVCGYDAATKKWTCYGFSAVGERYSYVMNNPPERDAVKTGDTFTATSRGIAKNGDKTLSKLKFVINGKDDYRVEITDGLIGGEKQPDIVLEFKRKR